MLENGHLLRTGTEHGGSIGGAAAGGRIQEFSWEGELLWDYSLSTESVRPHHDICPMPNGNVLVIAWDKKTAAEAASFIPKAAAKEAFLPAQPKPEDKLLAKKTAHTLRVKETPSQKEAREKKRCQGIVKAWTFSVWLWEGSPPPPAAPAVVLILISNSVSTNLNT